MNKISLFDTLRIQLPYAIKGYYIINKEIDITLSEEEAIKVLMLPYIKDGSYCVPANIISVFTCLVRAIKQDLNLINKGRSIHLIPKSEQDNILKSRDDFDRILNSFLYKYPGSKSTLLEDKKLNLFQIQKITFSGQKTNDKIILEGSNIFIIEAMFRYFHELNESNAFNYSNEIHTFFAYYISLKGTKKKRGYKRKHSNHELEDLKKYVATNLHKFLSNYTAIVPEERQTSEEEIRLIGELLNLSKLHPYAGNFDNSTIRNWITRR